MITNESKNEITVVFLSNYFVSESDNFVFLKSTLILYFCKVQ